MEAVARELIRRDIIPGVTSLRTLGQQVSDEIAELLLRSGDVLVSMQKRHGHAPEALPDMRDRLTGGKAPIGLLADLTDEQLDTVPPAVSSPFSDGSRTLNRVIDVVIAHQAAHLSTLKRSVA